MPPASYTPDKHPTMVGLFDKIYRVSIPTRMLQSIEEQRAFGSLATGDREIDNALRNERTYTYLSIVKMAGYFKEGVLIGVAEREDCRDIYDTVNDHLHAWATYLGRAVHISSAPLDDLMLLDRFATEVYKHARFEINRDPMVSGFAERLAKLLPLSPMTMFKARPVLMTSTRTEFENDNFRTDFIPHEAEHESLKDILKTSMVRSRR